jgi:putative FmdB family regulatory protein
MVTYRYSCENCEYEFDLEQRITEPPRKRCPKCRGRVYRVIHPVGHILKGSGFYRTDYRSPSFTKRDKEETAGSAPHPDTDAKKDNAKPKPDTP